MRFLLLTGDGITHFPRHRRVKRRLQGNLRVRIDAVVLGEIGGIQPLQAFRHIHVAVQIDVGVRGVIKPTVKREILLIRQLGDDIRVAAGIARVGRIRIQRALDLPLHHGIRRRVLPLHLVVDNAVDGQLLLRCLQFKMPALLAKNIRFVIDVRMQNRIHIDIHEIFEILVVAAGHGIDRLVRVCHGVQEGVH